MLINIPSFDGSECGEDAHESLRVSSSKLDRCERMKLTWGPTADFPRRHRFLPEALRGGKVWVRVYNH